MKTATDLPDAIWISEVEKGRGSNLILLGSLEKMLDSSARLVAWNFCDENQYGVNRRAYYLAGSNGMAASTIRLTGSIDRSAYENNVTVELGVYCSSKKGAERILEYLLKVAGIQNKA